MQARCRCDPQNAWWKKGVLSPRKLQARCSDLTDAQEEGGAIPGASFLRSFATKSKDPQNSGGRRLSPALPAQLCCCDQNAWWEGWLSCAVSVLAVVMIQNAWWKEGFCLRAMQAVVRITECSWEEGVLSCAVMHVSWCDPQNAWGRCVPPALPCMLLVIHRMPGGRRCYPRQRLPLLHDPQNVPGRCYPCHACCCCDPQNAWCKKGGAGACHASSLLLDSECSGARKACYPCAATHARLLS
jgi:hypothetical protein